MDVGGAAGVTGITMRWSEDQADIRTLAAAIEVTKVVARTPSRRPET